MEKKREQEQARVACTMCTYLLFGLAAFHSRRTEYIPIGFTGYWLELLIDDFNVEIQHMCATRIGAYILFF